MLKIVLSLLCLFELNVGDFDENTFNISFSHSKTAHCLGCQTHGQIQPMKRSNHTSGYIWKVLKNHTDIIDISSPMLRRD